MAAAVSAAPSASEMYELYDRCVNAVELAIALDVEYTRVAHGWRIAIEHAPARAMEHADLGLAMDAKQ